MSTISSRRLRCAVYSADGMHGVIDGDDTRTALDQWAEDHQHWLVSHHDASCVAAIAWTGAAYLGCGDQCAPTVGAYAQGTVTFPDDDGRSFEITVHCVPETSLRWKLAHSTSIGIDPLDLTWTTLHAWDDEALLNEILGRIDNEIVLLGVSCTEDVAASELDGEEHPSLTIHSLVPSST